MSNIENLEIPNKLLPSIDDLPGDLAQLARVIEEITPHKSVQIVLKLAEEYRGTSIYFHNLDCLQRKVRDIKIVKRYDNGERPANIARDVRLSERQIWKILGRVPDEDKQMKLF